MDILLPAINSIITTASKYTRTILLFEVEHKVIIVFFHYRNSFMLLLLNVTEKGIAKRLIKRGAIPVNYLWYLTQYMSHYLDRRLRDSSREALRMQCLLYSITNGCLRRVGADRRDCWCLKEVEGMAKRGRGPSENRLLSRGR